MILLLYRSFFFTTLGTFTSVSLCAGTHIFGFLALLIIFVKNLNQQGLKLFSNLFRRSSIPLSGWLFLSLSLWSYFINLVNFETLSDPLRSFGNEKYILFALSLILVKQDLNTILTPKRLKYLIHTLIGGAILATLYGITYSQLHFNLLTFSPLSGPVNPRNPGLTDIMRYGYGVGFVISSLFPILFIHLFESDKSKKMSLEQLGLTLKTTLIYLLVLMIGVYFAKTRGAILGMAFSFPFALYFYKKKTSIIIASVVTVSLGIVIYLVSAKAEFSHQNRLFIKLGSGSNMKRLSQYEAGLEAFKERILFGHGTHQFSKVCEEIKIRHNISFNNYCKSYPFLQCDYSKEPRYCSHTHNIYLETLANRGLIGGLLFVLAFVFWFLEAYKSREIIDIITMSFLVNFSLSGLFEYTLNANNSFMIFLFYAITKIYKIKSQHITKH